MKIIHLIKGGDWGGVARYVLDLCAAMSDSHDVTALSGATTEIDNRFKSYGVNIEKAPLKKFGDLRSFSALSKIAGRGEPVIIHVHSFVDAIPVVIARCRLKCRVAIVVTRHIVKRGSRSLLNRWIYKNVDRVVFPSLFAMEAFLSSNPPIDCNKLSVVHNSVKDYDSRISYDTASSSKSPLKLLFVGRICYGKGIEILLDAMMLLKDENLTLDIVGTGDDDYMKQMVRKADANGVGSRVRWLGFHENVHPFFEKADICVAPSVVPESFGLSILEGMAHGKPVITTDNGAQPEYISSGIDGLLVPSGNSVALSEAIRSLCVSAELRRRIGENALSRFCKRLSYPVFISKMMKIYEDVVNER